MNASVGIKVNYLYQFPFSYYAEIFDVFKIPLNCNFYKYTATKYCHYFYRKSVHLDLLLKIDDVHRLKTSLEHYILTAFKFEFLLA